MSPALQPFWLRVKARAVVIDEALPRGWKTALAALILVGIGVHVFALNWSTPLWLVSKLLMGGFSGLVVDWMGFPKGRPHLFAEGSPERLAAWDRRAKVIMGCVVAAGVGA